MYFLKILKIWIKKEADHYGIMWNKSFLEHICSRKVTHF